LYNNKALKPPDKKNAASILVTMLPPLKRENKNHRNIHWMFPFGKWRIFIPKDGANDIKRDDSDSTKGPINK